MLKHMTKTNFITYIDESRFMVKQLTPTRFEVLVITHQNVNGLTRYGTAHVINPDTKSGNFSQTGYGYNKEMACLEDIARYVDEHAEDMPNVSCKEYLMKNQQWNTI